MYIYIVFLKLIYLTIKHIDFSKDTRPLVRFYRSTYIYIYIYSPINNQRYQFRSILLLVKLYTRINLPVTVLVFTATYT